MRRPAIDYATYHRADALGSAEPRRFDRWLVLGAATYAGLNVACALAAGASTFFDTLTFFGLVGPFAAGIAVTGWQISTRPRPAHWATFGLLIAFLAATAFVNLTLLSEAMASV